MTGQLHHRRGHDRERLPFNAVPGAEELGTLKAYEGADLHAGHR